MRVAFGTDEHTALGAAVASHLNEAGPAAEVPATDPDAGEADTITQVS